MVKPPRPGTGVGDGRCASQLACPGWTACPTPATGRPDGSGDTEAGNATDRLRVETRQLGEVPPALGIVAVWAETGRARRQQDHPIACKQGTRLADGFDEVRRSFQHEAGRARDRREQLVD